MNPIIQFLLQNRGRLRYQDFTSSGTFTPSTALLAKQGGVLVILLGGGSGGTYAPSGVGNVGNGGNSGTLVISQATVTVPLTVTIGAGGSGGTNASRDGAAGGDSTFGALLTASGGRTIISPSKSWHSFGGSGCLGTGSFHPHEGTAALTSRGGVGWSSRGGGGGGACTPLDHHSYGADGGANASASGAVSNDALDNSGAGGGCAIFPSNARAGNGGSGWCRVVWFE